MTITKYFSWSQIFRLGLVQMSIGGVVVLTTSTLNRIMVVELLLPALIPGILVALHYAVQLIRPRMGFGSDNSGKCTPWIIGGMAILSLGGLLSTFATTIMFSSPSTGIVLAILGFLAIGIGVSAAGTALLTLLAKKVDEKKRAMAATIVWLMMIGGFALTAGISGQFLDPFSNEKLLTIASVVSITSFFLTFFALWNLEGKENKSELDYDKSRGIDIEGDSVKNKFFEVLKEIWNEKTSKQFTIFVFISMFAFSMQDLILEPFAGIVFEMSPGQTTSLSGIQHSGVLIGMIIVALLSTNNGFSKNLISLKNWIIGGCILSSLALFGIVLGGINGMGWPIKFNVFVLGIANGSFSIAAIAGMMQLAKEGKSKREGIRIGLWGASQAIAFGLGGLIGALLSDIARFLISNVGVAYSFVFLIESALFLLAANVAKTIKFRKTHNSGIDQKKEVIISSSGSI